MKLTRAALTYVRQWLEDHPDQCSKDFHNILMRQMPELRPILDLFLDPPPEGTGRYHHHDGYRT